MKSSMFLADVTCIDLAYVTHTGQIRGSSVSPKFIVSGEVTEDESVVVDFSKIKKQIKALIDDRDTGYDHKLWLFQKSDAQAYTVSCGPNDRIKVTTTSTEVILPSDAIKVVQTPCTTMEDMNVLDSCVEVDIENYLMRALRLEYPSINVECKLAFEGASMAEHTKGAKWFTYVHGLKNSSSFGCQNSSHGHLSYVQLLDANANWKHVKHPVLESIAQELDGTVFINAENIVVNTDDAIRIEYESCNRGTFTASYDKIKMKTQVLDTETTIECLVEFIKGQWWEELKRCGATHLAVSEGLSKGAVTELK